MGKCMLTRRGSFRFQSSHLCNNKCLPLLLIMFQFNVCLLDQCELQWSTSFMGNRMQTRRNHLLFNVCIFVMIGVCLYVLCLSMCLCLFYGSLRVAMEYMLFMGKCMLTRGMCFPLIFKVSIVAIISACLHFCFFCLFLMLVNGLIGIELGSCLLFMFFLG